MSKHPNLTDTTPEEGFNLFIRERGTESADSTIQSYKYRLNHFVRWCNQVNKIDNLNNLSGRDLHRYKLWRKEDGDLNQVSLKTQMDTLRVFIRFLESIDAVDTDLHSAVKSPTLSNGISQREIKLDPEEANKLIDYLTRYEYATFAHTLILLLWQTGLRMGSVRALDIDDFDPNNEHVAVRHRPDTDTPLKNKQNGERLVALNPTVCESLTDYIEVNRPKVADEFGRKPLLATNHGRPGDNTLRTTVYRWTRPCQYQNTCPHDRDQDDCEALAVRWAASKCPSSVSPHAVRRGSITHHLTQDVPEQVVSDRMNVSPDVLDKHYDKRSEEVKVEQRREYLDNI